MKGWIFCAVLTGASLGFAQQSETPAAQPSQEPAGQAAPAQPAGQVLFSGQPSQAASPASGASSAAVTDAERTAVAITAWDLDVHLNPRDQAMEVHARVTLRNASSAPLGNIALQLSSSLHLETVGLQGRKIAFATHDLASDADHTGKLTEASIPLVESLAPRAELTLDVDYGGTVQLTAARLTAIGAPDATAQASDWDRIAEDFTGVRGFGNVVWYPVSSLPVSLKDGAKLFAEVGRQKRMDESATVRLRLTDEFFAPAPNAVILNGQFIEGAQPTSTPTASFPGVLTVERPATPLGFDTPSFFVARRTEVDGHGLRVLATDADEGSGPRYVAAAGLAEPLVTQWLGKPKSTATILDLPETDDAAAETGEMLAAPLSSDDAAHLAPVVIHALAHAAFRSPRAWLNEGVAAFAGTLWIEQSLGQASAIENLNADRPALAVAEPAAPGEGSGEDLLHAEDAVYFRTKAEYVLWMLRDVAGDKALAMALAGYNAAQDTTPDYFQKLLEEACGRDLKWFFDDWVYRDRGLPDLSIASVFPSRESAGQYLVAVDLVNDGYAAAEVPVTVKGMSGSATERVLIPAHSRITHRITFSEDPVEVDLNDGTVPEVRDSVHQKILTAAPPR
jgi:hypothetical protein